MKKYFLIIAILLFGSFQNCLASNIIYNFDQSFSPRVLYQPTCASSGTGCVQMIKTPTNYIDGINLIVSYSSSFTKCIQFQVCKNLPSVGQYCDQSLFTSQSYCGTTSFASLINSTSTSNTTSWSKNILASTTICTIQPYYWLNIVSTSTSGALDNFYPTAATSSNKTDYSLSSIGSNLYFGGTTSNSAPGGFINRVWGGDIQSCIGTTTISTTTINITGGSATTTMTTPTTTPATTTDIGVISSYTDGTYTYYNSPFLLFSFVFVIIFLSIISSVLYITIKKK